MALNLRRLLIGKELLETLPKEAINGTGLADIEIFGIVPPLYVVYIIAITLSIILLIVSYLRINKKHKK